MAPSSGPFQLVVPGPFKGKRRVSTSQGPSEAGAGLKEGKQRKMNKLPKQPVASSSKLTVEESTTAPSQPRQSSSKLKKQLPAPSQPTYRPAGSPARRDKDALWIELDSGDESEDVGDVAPKNALPIRIRGSTAQAAPEPSSKKRRRSSTKVASALARSAAAAPSPQGSPVNPRVEKRFNNPFVFSRETSEAASVEEEEEREVREPSPELAAPASDFPARRKEEKVVTSEEPYLPPRKEITHDFYIEIPVRRKKLPSATGSNKVKAKGKGLPGRRDPLPSTSKAPTPFSKEDSGDEDEAISVVSGPSASRAGSSGPPPTKKRKVDPVRAPPSPSLSPASSHRPRNPHVVRKPSPLAQRQPSPTPTPPPAQPFGALVDRPPPPPPPLPHRTLNPNYEPAVRFGGWVNGTFPPPSPPVSTISLSSAVAGGPGAQGKGKKRARSADPLLLEGFKIGPQSSSSTSSAPGGAPLLAQREETSSGRTSIEPSPAPPLSPTRITSVPILPAPSAASLRRTGRATIQALPPSSVALRASSALVGGTTLQSLPTTQPPRPDDQKKMIRKRWAFLKETHGVGDDAHLSFEDNWRREDGARNIREKRGQERWKGAKSRQWWKEEREQEFEDEQAGSGADEEKAEKGWQYATKPEVVPWEWEGIDLGRGRAWNAGEGMEPGKEEHGRRWAVSDPQAEEESSAEEQEDARPVVSMEAIRAAMGVDMVAETDEEGSDDCIVVEAGAVPPSTTAPSTAVALAPSAAPHQPVARVLPPRGRGRPVIAPTPSAASRQPPTASTSRSEAPRQSAAPIPSVLQPAPRPQKRPSPLPPPPQSAPTHFASQHPQQQGNVAFHYPPPPHGAPPYPYWGQPHFPYGPPPAHFGGYYPPPPPGYYHHYPPPPPHHYPYPSPYPPYHPQHPPQHAPHPAAQPARSSSSSSSRQRPAPQAQPQPSASAPPPSRQTETAPPPLPQRGQRADALWSRSMPESGSGKSTPREVFPKPQKPAPREVVPKKPTPLVPFKGQFKVADIARQLSQPAASTLVAPPPATSAAATSTQAPSPPRPAIARPGSLPNANSPIGSFSRSPSTRPAPSASPKRATPIAQPDTVATASSSSAPPVVAGASASVSASPARKAVLIFASTAAPSPVASTSTAAALPAPTTNGKAISLSSDSSSDTEDSEAQQVAETLRTGSAGQQGKSAEFGSPNGRGKVEDDGEGSGEARMSSPMKTKDVEVLVLSD